MYPREDLLYTSKFATYTRMENTNFGAKKHEQPNLLLVTLHHPRLPIWCIVRTKRKRIVRVLRWEYGILLNQKPPKPRAPRAPRAKQVSWVIFRKWWKPDVIDNDWYVVRADTHDGKGQIVGRVGAKGPKNYYTKAAAIAQERNLKILEQRKQAFQALRVAGWTERGIQATIDKIQAEVKQEMGPDYREEL